VTAVATRPRPAGAAPPPGRMWPALARREARFTLRHPIVLAGIIASAYLLWSFNRDELPHLGGYSSYVGLGLAPLAGAALLVAHLQTSRAHRHGTLEIEEPAPAARRARTLGHLVGSLVVMLPAAVIVAVYMGYLFWRGGTGAPNLGELLIGVLVVGVAAAAGVAAGTWLPNRFGGLIGLGLVAVVQIGLQDAPGTLHWFSWWHTVLWYGGFGEWIRPTGAHVVYLAGALAVVGAAASLRHGVRPAPSMVAGLGLALVVAGGVVQIRPPDRAAVERIWDQVSNPAGSWVTVTRDDATYDVLAGYQRWIDWWDAVISDTVAPIATADRPALVVEQWPHPFPSQLLDEFTESDPEWQTLMERANDHYFGSSQVDPWPIQVGEALTSRDRAPFAIAVAVRAVGLPLLPVLLEGRAYTADEIAMFDQEPTDPTVSVSWSGEDRGVPRPVLGDHLMLEVACTAEGQAREVVAAWLAAQASSAVADRYRDIRQHGPAALGDFSEVFTEYLPDDGGPAVPAVLWGSLGWIQRGGYGGWASGVAGSPTATDLAAQLLERPREEVTAALRQHWDEWTNPATPVQTIIDAFGLEPPPTPAQWIERAGRDPADYAESIAAYPRWIADVEYSAPANPSCQ
jgi:hypothetical protein